LGIVRPAVSAPSPIVFVQKAERTELFDVLTYPARVTAKVSAAVLSEVEGVIFKLVTPLGAKVAAGDVLMIVKNTDPVFDYAATQVKAPVAGIVGAAGVTEGSRVTKGQHLVTVTDPSFIKLLIEVSGPDLAEIVPKLPGTVVFPGDEKLFTVKVAGVAGEIDPATGTATAELSFIAHGEDQKRIRPGLLGKASFKVREHWGFEIPESALVYHGEHTFLRFVEDNHVKVKPISIGLIRRGKVEVLKGLSAHEAVVMRSSIYVADGESVQVESVQADKN
jgi:multidrug efflux pump subunit AcrA (membrane-fusion protein)